MHGGGALALIAKGGGIGQVWGSDKSCCKIQNSNNGLAGAHCLYWFVAGGAGNQNQSKTQYFCQVEVKLM